MAILLYALCFFQNGAIKMPADPFLFEGVEEFSHHGISSVDVHNQRIFIASFRVPYFLVLDAAGNVLQKVGHAGQGPGEFRNGIWSLAVTDRFIWAQSASIYDAFQLFEHLGKYVQKHRFPGSSMMFGFSLKTSGATSLKNALLIPSGPDSAVLGYAIDESGAIQKIGKAQKVSSVDSAYAQSRIWATSENEPLYCLFQLSNQIKVFDRKTFEQKETIKISHPLINKNLDDLSKKHFNHNEIPVMVFTDMKIKENHIYVYSYYHGLFVYCLRDKKIVFHGIFDAKAGPSARIAGETIFALRQNGEILSASGAGSDQGVWLIGPPIELAQHFQKTHTKR